MRLVDTSAWVEALLASPTGLKLAPELPRIEDWLVPTIVQLELAKWANRDPREANVVKAIAASTTRIVAPLTTEIAFLAAELCQTHKLATADAVVYATAQEYGADLLTCDAHFEKLPGVLYIAKKNR